MFRFVKNSLDLVNLFSVPQGYRLFSNKILVPNSVPYGTKKKTVAHLKNGNNYMPRIPPPPNNIN